MATIDEACGALHRELSTLSLSRDRVPTRGRAGQERASRDQKKTPRGIRLVEHSSARCIARSLPTRAFAEGPGPDYSGRGDEGANAASRQPPRVVRSLPPGRCPTKRFGT